MIRPAPETRTAILISAATGRPTKHVFVETRATDGGTGWEHIYRCTRSGRTRRWGLEERTIRSWEKAGN